MHAHHRTRPPAPLRVLLTALLLASGLTAAGVASPAAAAARADLTVAAVTAPATATAGGRVALRAVVRNAGRRDARATTTRFAWSRDRTWGRTDTTLGQVRTRAVARRDRRTVRLTASLPASASGRGYVVVCADAKRTLRESREANNCRASDAVQVGSPSATPTFPLDPDPLAVGGSTLQTARRVTATAGTEAPTTITATANDGTTYTLTIPPTALLSEERITMTPVAAVAGLPLSEGLRAAVQLEPHGLMLQTPATLVIDSPDLGALERQTPFVFHEGGEDLHAHPVAAPRAADDQDVVRLQLSHFSTAGVGSGTPADRSNLAAHPPARPSSQLSSSIAELTRAERASQEAGNPPNPNVTQQAVATLEAYLDQVVSPRLDAATGNPELAPGAIAEAIAVARQIALLGDEDNPRAAAILQKVVRLLESLIATYDTRCQQHDITAIAQLVGLARQLALLAGDESAGATRAFDAALRCARYKVELDSTVDHTRNFSAGNSTNTLNAHVRMQSTTNVPALASGVGALEHTEASLHQRQEGDGAWVDDALVSTSPGSITVDVLERANPIDPGPGGTPALPVPYVRLLPGVGAGGATHEPTERLRRTTSLPGYEPTETDVTFWMDSVLGFSEFFPLRFEEDLEPKAGEAVLLEKTRDGSFGSVSSVTGLLTEHRVVTVTHTPQAG